MDTDKIENNPTYQNLKKNLEGAEALQKITELAVSLGIGNDCFNELFEKLPNFRKQLEILSKAPDRFNHHFSKLGWIAHESMNTDMMLKCIELADHDSTEIAENYLIDYYSSEKMKGLIYTLKGIEAFDRRYNFFLLAYEDTIAERYHAAVPVLLIMIDGIVNDIDKRKGFFAENTNLTTWDSIAAHSTGLSSLKEIFSNSRQKTNDDELSLPYRHGIIHGRDLGYANRMVTAKCWAALFSISDWADAVRSGKKVQPPLEPDISEEEIKLLFKKSLATYEENKKNSVLINKKLNEWKSRTILVGQDIPEKGVSSDYIDFTPEQEAIRFAEYWTKGNFGAISEQIHHFSKAQKNKNMEAGKVRNVFIAKKLIDYKITKVLDCSPSISEITLYLNIEYEERIFEKHITLRLIYQGTNNEMITFGDEGGKWKYINFFFHEIANIVYE